MTARLWSVAIGLPALLLLTAFTLQVVLQSNAVTGSVELFDWKSWSAQQEHLIHSADALTGGLSRAQRTGKALQQKLGDISHLMPHKIIPMDQALAMLKVQKQMRREDRVPHDRIEGAGDVAGLVDEQDEAMERNALMEPAEGPDIDTSNLFENCEDGSLTAEDAELCQRRASAIKLLTKSAVNAQLAKALAGKAATPTKTKAVSDAQKELLAEAEIGKQYLERLRLLNERQQGLSVRTNAEAGHSGKAPNVGAAPPHVGQLAATPSEGATSREVKCSCREQGGALPGYEDGTAPACSCSGGAASSLLQQPLHPMPHRHAKHQPTAPTSAPAQTHRSKQAEQRSSAQHAARPKPAARAEKGDLGALASIATAAEKAAPQRAAGKGGEGEAATREADMDKGGEELAALEKQISAGEAALAAKKLQFTEELTRRQQRLQAAFLRSVSDVRQGLQLVDAVPLAPPPPLQQLAPLPQSPAASSPPVGSLLAKVAQSPQFQHPPPAARSAPAHPSEQATLRAALDQQFAQVAAVRASPSREQALADSLHAAHHRRRRRLRQQHLQQLRAALRTAGVAPHPPPPAGHIGAASYSALSAAARQDLAAAGRGRGQPTLAAAATKALAADKVGGAGAGAQLADAERVLCTVARLEQGLCSGTRPRAHPRRPTQALRLYAPAHRHAVVRQPPSVATLANDVVHNMEGIFKSP